MLAPTSRLTPGVALPGWDTFAVVTGGAAGALIGLLFVSVSIRIDVISASPDFRNRGAATLSLFVIVLLVAIVLVVPGQDAWQLGAELLVLALTLGGMLWWLNRRATAHPSGQAISRVLAIVSPTRSRRSSSQRRACSCSRRRRRGLCRDPGRDRRDRRRRRERVAVPHQDRAVRRSYPPPGVPAWHLLLAPR
jgi:hypothetical protein